MITCCYSSSVCFSSNHTRANFSKSETLADNSLVSSPYSRMVKSVPRYSTSRLVVSHADVTDTGRYSCSSLAGTSNATSIHVIKGKIVQGQARRYGRITQFCPLSLLGHNFHMVTVANSMDRFLSTRYQMKDMNMIFPLMPQNPFLVEWFRHSSG